MCVCVCLSACASRGPLTWVFCGFFYLILFNRIHLNKTWAHSESGVQFLVQPLGVRLDTMLCKDCSRTCLWSRSRVFSLNNLSLSLMDCQETDITQTGVQYGIFCPEPSLCKHCKVSASLVSKDVFHWVFEFTPIVTPVGARKAIIVNVLTSSLFPQMKKTCFHPVVIFLAFWHPSASMGVVLFFDEIVSRAFLLFSQLILFKYSFCIPVHLIFYCALSMSYISNRLLYTCL